MLKYSSRPTTASRLRTTHAPGTPSAPVSRPLIPAPSSPPPSPASMASGPVPPTRWNIPRMASAKTAAPVAAIQRSAGIVFIHSISAKPASSGAANAMPQPSEVESTSCQGWTIAPASGAKRAITLRMARKSEHEREPLADEAPAHHEGRRLTSPPRRAAPRRRPRRVATRVRPPSRSAGSSAGASCAGGRTG